MPRRNLLVLALICLVAVIAVVVLRRGESDGAATTTIVITITTLTTTTMTTSTITPITTTTIGTTGYTADELAYFTEVAGGAEFGESGVVHRWETGLRIAVAGTPDASDLAALDAVVADLDAALASITIDLDAADPNVTIHFAPESEFAAILPGYVPVNLGFFWVWWDGTGAITDATVLISTTGTTQAEQEHLLREELTQTLGLMNDSWSYPDSIFYQGWTEVGGYAPIDLRLIDMLYHPAIRPGMTIAAAVAQLGG